jgi:hypothetical protein
MAHKKSKGERVGTVPFGYDLASDGIALVKNSKEQASIELMSLLRQAGMSLPKIAALLTRKGIKTKQGAESWTPKTVSRLIERTAA